MNSTIRHLLTLAVLCVLPATPFVSAAHSAAYAVGDEDFATGNTRYKAQDYLGAYAKWRVAADDGHAGAANNIGHLFRAGLGVKQDYPAALKWFHKAADGGAAIAMHNIGLMYESGLGVKIDKAEAIKWYRKAAAGGVEAAKASIERASAKPKVAPKKKPTPVARPRAASGAFLGEVRVLGFNFAPREWADCNGQLLPIAKHQSLFSLLGTIYGGDGRKTFALPDLRGRTPVHPGKTPSQRVLKLGQKFGGAAAARAADEQKPTINGIGLRYVIALRGEFPSRSKSRSADRMVGEIVMFAGNFAPNGWLRCDGQKLAISGNEVAFSVLGKTYGGTETTFCVPDLRGSVAVHPGTGSGLAPVRFGERGDAKTFAAAAGGTKGVVRMASHLCIQHLIVMDGVDPKQFADEAFMGEIRMFAGKRTPRGWAPCDGTLKAIASSTALFSLYGTTFGGDGRTTMGLPDLRGRWPVHAGDGPGLAQVRLGQRWGVAGASATKSGQTVRAQPWVSVRYLARVMGVYPSRN